MTETLDLQKIYSELNETIKKSDYNQCLNIANKILNSFPNEKEAIQCKLVSLINLGKSDELITFIEKNSLQKEYYLEYAYCLYDSKEYKKSLEILNNLSEKSNEIEILKAQNYYKSGEFNKSYEIYKKLIEEKIKNNELENYSELFSNFLSSFALSKSNDEEFLKKLEKFSKTWENYFNFSIVYLQKGDYEKCFEILKKIKEEFPNFDDEFNELKNLLLTFYIIQNILDGFEISKYSNIHSEFDKFFDKLKKNKKNSDLIKLFPYFYNNMLFYRKDKDSPTETVKKFDTILKDKQLNSDEKKIILKNKINFLIRGNKINEANEELKNLLNNENDSDLILLKCYLVYKTEKKKEKIIEILSNDEKLKNIPEVKLFILQLMLQTLNVKNPEKIHKSILNFINDYKEFSYNEKFLSFFIGFYLSRKLYSQLKEFINNFNDLKQLQNKINNNQNFKKIIIKIGNFYYITNDYENSIKYYKYYLDNIDNKDKEITILLIQSLSHNNIEEAEKLRRNIDETVIDLSNESINNLLSELFTKFKRQDKINKKKKKHKKKKRYPKNFNPKNPGPMPDPERWLPKMQKKKFRAKNKLAHQGAIADNETTTTQKFK